MKGLNIRNGITCSELVGLLHQQLNIDLAKFEIHIKCCYNLLILAPPIDILDDEIVVFFFFCKVVMHPECHCLY